MSEYGKWPRLLVVGDNVTHEQANEILVRTDEWDGFTNDRFWRSAVDGLASEFGCPVEPPRNREVGAPSTYWDAKRDWKTALGILDLAYLDNHRIASSWIGGPHGWCDWDGTIGCSTYNLGKYPTEEEITADWVAIAEAFPYLRLHAQLVADEGEGEVLATWAVRDGMAGLVEPVEQITPVSEPDIFACLRVGGERGVTLWRLREALKQVTDDRREVAS